MTYNWQHLPFEKAIQKIVYTKKIPRKQFLEIGDYPIISQESDFINGRWDDEVDVFKVSSPVVIFGDHTKIVKHIDFDFVLGADGIKILKPIESLGSKFLAYFLKSVPIADLGYARHYRLLKELSVPLPSIPEQKRIVAILDQAFADIDKARANAEQNLKNARELFESYLQQVFSQRGEGWAEKRLENLCAFSSGGTPSKKNSSYWSGDIPWVSGRDMKSAQLFDSFLHISQSAVEETSTRMAPAGTILTLIRGMGLAHGAQVAELMVPCAYNQDIKGIYPEPYMVSRYLVFALRHRINSSENVLSSAAHGTLKINMSELKNVFIPVPPKDQQEEIVNRFDVLIQEINYLKSIYTKKLLALNELKKSILQKAFSGELTKDQAA